MLDPAITERRLRYRAHGFSCIPVNGKIPHYAGWETWHDMPEDKIRGWGTSVFFKDYLNTSFLARNNPFLDIDIYDPEAVEEIIELLSNRYDQFLVRTGMAPKRRVLFRLAGAPFAKYRIDLIPPGGPDGKTHRIELLSDGQQFVVDGIHPDTLRPYIWNGGSPDEIDLADLPGVDEATGHTLVDECVALLLRRGYQLVGKSKTSGNGFDHDGFDWSGIFRDQLDHDALVPTAMAMMRAGMHDGAVFNLLHACIVTAPHADAKRQERRLQELPSVIRSGRAKIGEPSRPAQPTTLQQFQTLMRKTFAELKWVLPHYIPEGVTLLAGKPKIGKSWYVLALTLACGGNGTLLGESCQKRGVLYCALEDTERRMQARCKTILASYWEHIENVFFTYELPTLDHGLAERLRELIKQNPSINLIIIDTLARIRGAKRKDEDPYQHDYRTMSALQDLYRETGVDIIVVHHVRKATADDVFETISGTHGLSGACDTMNVFTYAEDNTVRYCVRGRDAEPQDKLLLFDGETGEWTVTGDYEGKAGTKAGAKQLILAALATEAHPMSPAQVAKMTGLKESTVQATLARAAKAGECVKNSYGAYHAK